MVMTTIIALVVVVGGEACVTGVVFLFPTHTAQTATSTHTHILKKNFARFCFFFTRSSIKKEMGREMSE